MLPVSNDTLLRVERRRPLSGIGALNVVGIDDCGFSRVIGTGGSSAIWNALRAAVVSNALSIAFALAERATS